MLKCLRSEIEISFRDMVWLNSLIRRMCRSYASGGEDGCEEAASYELEHHARNSVRMTKQPDLTCCGSLYHRRRWI